MKSEEVFSKNLNKYMEHYNITQVELAEALGVTSSAVHKWCKGKGAPRMDKIDAICDYFNIDRKHLIEEDAILIEVTPAEDMARRIARLSAYDQKFILAMLEKMEENDKKEE